MKRLKHYILVLFVLIFSGCIYPNNYINNSVNFSTISNNLIQQLDKPIKQYIIPSDTPILVSDFVNLDTLNTNSKLGFLLADLVKNDLIRTYGISVREVKLSQNFILGKSGFKILSNKVSQVNNQITDAAYALVGTYTFTNQQIIISLKIVDVRTGLLIGSAITKNILTSEIIELDSAQSANNIYAPTVL
jgi:TolB-like protein